MELKRVGSLNIVQRFSVLSFLFIFLITMVGTLILFEYMKNLIIEREAILVSQFMSVEARQHQLEEGLRRKSFSEISREFNGFLREFLAFPEIVRIKIYDDDGVIIWSDNQSVIGSKFAKNYELDEALSGRIAASLGVPDKAEHSYERQFEQIMEVYTPIFGADQQKLLGVIETYKHPVSLIARIEKTRKIAWSMALFGGISLYVGLFGIVYSSHRKQVRLEEDVEASHRRYMDLIENSPEMIHQVDAKRMFLHVNRTETERLGYSLDEMKEMKVEDLVPEEHKEEMVRHFERILAGEKSTLETVVRTSGGEDIDVEINETGFFDEKSSELIQSRAFIRDITRRKAAEREIRFLNEYYYTILGSMNSYVRVINANRKVEFENQFFEDQFGQRVTADCSPFRRWEKPCDSSLAELTLSTGLTQTGEAKTADQCFYSITSIPMKSRDGSTSAIEIITDVTDRKKLEQEIIQQEKLASMGLLATGLAHEIGNPIGIVEGAVQFCLQKLSPKEPVKEYLEVIQRNISAADRTIKQLLRFARPAENERTECNLIELIKETNNVVAPEMAQRGIQLAEEYCAGHPYVFVDRTNLQQVFVNILLNSVEALNVGGEITITTRRETSSDNVEILFTDNGPGIPDEYLSQVITPFFTTKEEGTGLGLSICQRVVEAHGGKLAIGNLPRGGARIGIVLPATWKEASDHG